MFRAVNLFGGAARMDVPSHWIDASTLRDVPDNQEVFVDESGDWSVIVEILELQEDVPNEHAARFFFKDLAEADAAVSADLIHVSPVGERELLGTKAAVCFGKGIQVKGKSGPSATPHPVEVHMTVFRSKKFDADILVTLHCPPDQIAADSLHSHVSDSLEFLDPGLFV